MLMTAPRRIVLAAFVIALVLAQPLPAVAQLASFFKKLNPLADTVEKFDGKFIDNVRRGQWQPPVIDREAGSTPRATTTGGKGDDTGFDEEKAAAEDAAPPVELPDGRTVFRVRSGGLVQAPDLAGYLNGIAAKLMRGAPQYDMPVDIVITADENFGAAIALPDGVIGLPIGMLREIESEDELAFILGHELSHVMLNHHKADWLQNFQEQFLSVAEVGLEFAAALSRQSGMATGIQEKAKRPLLYVRGSLMLTELGLLPAWTRKQEDEADLLGLDLMIGAGYNPNEVFTVMAKLAAWEEDVARQEAARKEARKVAQDRDPSVASGDLQTAMRNLLRSAFDDFRDAVGGALGRKHRDMEKRQASLDDYYEREYEELVEPPSAEEAWTSVIGRARNARLLENYDIARKVSGLIDQGKLGEAERSARKAVSSPTKNHTATRLAFFRVRAAQGKLGLAEKNLELAMPGPYEGLIVHLELADLYWKSNQRRKSIAILEAAWEEFKRPVHLYPWLIDRYRTLGDIRRAESLAVECKLRARKLSRRCGDALAGRIDLSG